jgi:hypothetical protein
MIKATRVALGLVLAGGLAACAGGTVGSAYLGTYHPSMLHYAAGKGDMYTEVVGNPFDAPKQEVERVVTGAMFGSHFGPNVRFNTARDPENTSPYRVVVMFNPGPNVTPAKLCENSQQPSAPASGTLRVMLAFCAGHYRETSVSGRVAAVSHPNHAAFRGLIRQMTTQLFPPKNPNLLDGDSEFDI